MTPAVPKTALDIVREVFREYNQRGDFYVDLTTSEAHDLTQIVNDFNTHGTSSMLEQRAKQFLMSYRLTEMKHPVLTHEMREELEQILGSRKVNSTFSWPTIDWSAFTPGRRAAAVGLVFVLALGGIGLAQFIKNSRAGSPPAGIAQQHPPALQVPIGTTELQNFKQNYGPFNQITPSDQKPQLAQPALLLLEDGGYFASTQWTVTPTAVGWHEDIAGNVNNVDVHGSYVDITDAVGSPYLVGTDQPFMFSGNPGTVLRIDATGNVMSMSLAQATAVRQPLSK